MLALPSAGELPPSSDGLSSRPARSRCAAKRRSGYVSMPPRGAGVSAIEEQKSCRGPRAPFSANGLAPTQGVGAPQAASNAALLGNPAQLVDVVDRDLMVCVEADRPSGPQLRHLAAHRFNGQPEEITDLLA